MKYLVTSGCSFTSATRVNVHRTDDIFLNEPSRFHYYPHWLQKKFPNIKVFNMGNPGNNNALIVRSIIFKVKELIKKGVNPAEIAVIVQWSSYFRRSHLISKELVQKIAARAKTASPQQTALRAFLELIADKIEEKTSTMSVDKKSAGGGSLHFLFPQHTPDGKILEPPLNAQVDIMVGNLNWLKFSYYSDVYAGNVKGLHRTQLMLAAFAAKGYTFVHGSGIKNKETNEVEANTPEEAIRLLNRLYGFKITPEILQNYFKLRPFLEENISTEEYNKILDTYLKILDSTRADIPEDIQQYWIDNQQRLDLKGKFLPDDSKLTKYKTIQESVSLAKGIKIIIGRRK